MTRRGFTLVELIATIAIIGIATSIASVSLRVWTRAPAHSSDALVDSVRGRAIRSATALRSYADSLGSFVALPNGMIVADSSPRFRAAGRDNAQ